MESPTIGSANAGSKSQHYLLGLRILLACVAALMVMAAFGIYESIFLDRKFLDEGPPDFSKYFLWRTAVLMACAGSIVFLVQRASELGPKPNFDHIGKKMRRVILACATLGIGFSVLFLLSPKAFSYISVEDRMIEWSSAAALFLGCAFALRACVRAYAARSKIEAITLLSFTGLLFVIGMEEISWLQRIIGYQTPYWLSGYHQGEANIHNVMTSLSENVYYVGAFCFLIALPFANDFLRLISRPHWLYRLLPTRKSALVAAPMVGFTWDMWNVIPIQMTVFLTLFILIGYAVAASRYGDPARNLVLIALFATVLPLAVFLCFGAAQERSWETTEYKEMFIAFGLLTAATAMTFSKRSDLTKT